MASLEGFLEGMPALISDNSRLFGKWNARKNRADELVAGSRCIPKEPLRAQGVCSVNHDRPLVFVGNNCFFKVLFCVMSMVVWWFQGDRKVEWMIALKYMST